MDKKQHFGLRLQSLRRARGLSQERLAELIDRSKDAVSKMERGVNLPAFDTILRLADCLGVSAADLFRGADEPDLSPEMIDLQARLAVVVGKLEPMALALLVEQAEVLEKGLAVLKKQGKS